MTYVDSLEVELAAAGIPARRRARIVAEFSDHLHENPEAELGAPRDLARQFADELGTRLARGTAYRAFAALAVAAIVLAVMFFTGGRTWGGWVGYGHYRVSDYLPWWWVPMMLVCFISAQVALASGGLALLRAWRLRRVPVMTAADAAILNRRAAVGLVCGAIAMTVLPLTHFVVDFSSRWNTVAVTLGPALIVLLLAILPDVLRAARLRPTREGTAGDLTADLGIEDPRATPRRIVVVLSVMIVLVMVAIGVRSYDLYDGILRGLFDGAACLVGFAVLGQYLGLRRSGID
ncbi:MAG: hypothetical protein ACLPZR_08715 [Solirubrobacteraceae bacterium]